MQGEATEISSTAPVNEGSQQSTARSMQKSTTEQQTQKEWEVGKDYEIKKIIGWGSYGKVAEAIHKPSGRKVAIKKMLNLFEDVIDTKRLLREIQILKQLDNRNVVKLYDMLELQDPKNFKNIYLVLELTHSDLKKLLKTSIYLTDLHI